jgi:hypothetical protein
MEPNDQIAAARIFIQEVYGRLRSAGIEVWLDAGSLLKAYRGEDFALGSDVDFGLWAVDYDRVVENLKALENEGFIIQQQGNFPIRGDLIKIFFPDPQITRPRNVDLYFYSKSKSEVYRKGYHKPSPNDNFSVFLFIMINKLNTPNLNKKNLSTLFSNLLPCCIKNFLILFFLIPLYKRFATTIWTVLPKLTFDSLLEVETSGGRFLIPSNTESYLYYRYGKNWSWRDNNWQPADGSYIQHRRLRGP